MSVVGEVENLYCQVEEFDYFFLVDSGELFKDFD